MVAYSAKGKSIEQLLDDYEKRLLDADYGGSTTDYLQAAISARAAQAASHWAKVAALAACSGIVIAVAAVIVAALR